MIICVIMYDATKLFMISFKILLSAFCSYLSKQSIYLLYISFKFTGRLLDMPHMGCLFRI